MINNCTFGYLSHRIVFYLLNLHIKSRRTYFVRVTSPPPLLCPRHHANSRCIIADVKVQAGTASENSYKTDASLSSQGVEYAMKMTETLLKHRENERQAAIKMRGPDQSTRPLIVWTSPRRRTVETAQFLYETGYRIRQRSQMSQLHPGVCEKMSERRIRLEYPEEVAKHEADPYHHRYPRAEVSKILRQSLRLRLTIQVLPRPRRAS